MILITKLKVPGAKFQGIQATRQQGSEENSSGFKLAVFH
jgi:hypothetical protein